MNNEILATKIVDALLTTGAGRGTRLAVKREEAGREFDLGGWGRIPAIRRVADVLFEVAKEGKITPIEFPGGESNGTV